MTVQELRIGNWVSHRGIADVQVSLQMFADTHFMIKENDIASLRPIPLTEEWLLLKFGFSKATWHGDIGESDVDGYVLDNLFWIDNNFVLFRWTESLIKIQYVHQLQNLYFALTGQELEIVN